MSESPGAGLGFPGYLFSNSRRFLKEEWSVTKRQLQASDGFLGSGHAWNKQALPGRRHIV